jgi:hypothetical protein
MTTEERLEALERGLSAAKRRNKYLLIGLVVFALGFGFTITTGAVQAQPDENIIRAEMFELVDSQGNTRARLGVDDSGSALLALSDKNGEPRVVLSVTDIGPGLGMFDDLGPGLELLDENWDIIWSAP